MNSGPHAHASKNVAQEEEAQTAAPATGPITGHEIETTPEKPMSRRERRRAGKSSSAFKTISEVADELDVQQHVLRFWETKFSQIRPLKRGGGRRYYRPEDMELLKKIHHLLYTEGYTIKGVQKLLREKGKASVMAESPVPQNNNEPAPEASTVESAHAMNTAQRAALKAVLAELKDLRAIIKR